MPTVSPSANGAFSTQLNLSAFNNGVVTITASVVEASGNSSTTTAQAIKDTTDPSVPSSLAARALSNSDLFVSWSPATDGGSGISHYEVILNSGTPIRVNGTSYSFRPATNTIYSIAVGAHDKAGNMATSGTIKTRSQSGSSITVPDGSNVTVSLRPSSGNSPISVTFASASGSNRDQLDDGH
ncbi:MAG: fibronectin type III domain-containing protein [Candidatus Aquicultor sp.]|nr:fibronectin type III domain-containing protein [Candidatus Aquicultor sp.]